MLRQVEMQNKMQLAHRQFMDKLEESIGLIGKDIQQASEVQHVCTDEWCTQTEYMIDELHKFIYSISEPSWTDAEDSKKLRDLRSKLHDLYADYRTLKQ
jgi:type II secretory pathway component PulJ